MTPFNMKSSLSLRMNDTFQYEFSLSLRILWTWSLSVSLLTPTYRLRSLLKLAFRSHSFIHKSPLELTLSCAIIMKTISSIDRFVHFSKSNPFLKCYVLVNKLYLDMRVHVVINTRLNPHNKFYLSIFSHLVIA